MKDIINDFKQHCADRMKTAADLNYPMDLAEQNELFDELASGVDSIFYDQHLSTPFRDLLVDYAFCCRVRFFAKGILHTLIQTKGEFGNGVIAKYLQARETPRIGQPGTAFSLPTQGLMSLRCTTCRKAQAKA